MAWLKCLCCNVDCLFPTDLYKTSETGPLHCYHVNYENKKVENSSVFMFIVKERTVSCIVKMLQCWVLVLQLYDIAFIIQKVNEYDQEMPQSQTIDQPMVRRERDIEHWQLQNWAVTCDFQRGILTSVDSYEPLQPPFKLKNPIWCSDSSLTVIEYSSDLQWLWSDYAYAHTDLRLCWSHIPHCWKFHAMAQLKFSRQLTLPED